MAASIRPLVAGNWKMNGLQQSVAELTRMIAGCAGPAQHTDLMICPPATLINRFAELTRGTAIAIGAQDCHAEASGAYTGDLSAEMLKDAGAVAVIVGHSERRTLHQETDETVKAKAKAVGRAGLSAIVCLGETRAEREASQTLTVIRRQFDHSLPDDVPATQLVIAYEPVWAIGTGLTPTPGDIAEVHGFLRQRLTARYGNAGAGVRILYGGSVKPGNAKELMAIADVNGALIGGASLKADDFLAIASAYN